MIGLGFRICIGAAQSAGTPAPATFTISAEFTEVGDILDITTPNPADGNFVWALVAPGDTVTKNGVGGWTGDTVLFSGTPAVGADSSSVTFDTGATEGVTYDLFLYQRTAAGIDSNVITTDYTKDGSPAAVGGTESVITVGGLYYRIHQFTANGTLTFARETSVDALLVGGGGAGGGVHAYGVGASGASGQVLTGTMTLAAGQHAVSIGQGAVGIIGRAPRAGDTSAFGLVAKGGQSGGGRDSFINYDDPGDGAGVANFFPAYAYLLTSTGAHPSGTQAGVANKNYPSNVNFCASAGASSAHNGGDSYSEYGNGTGSKGADGADGVLSSITGVPTYYAGTSAGNLRAPGVRGKGGLGGGVDGLVGGDGYLTKPGGDATFYGASGGGGYNTSGVSDVAIGGDGYQGIVIVRYQITQSEFEAAQ